MSGTKKRVRMEKVGGRGRERREIMKRKRKNM
jgi:hypothetical protein